jgi:dTDP-4-amino-4,6-dideoxygalactose transaminase
VQRIRGRFNGVGAVLQAFKRGMGLAAGALEVHRANVGDIGFNLDEVDLAMSPVSTRLLQRLDYPDIRRRRSANYRQLLQEIDAHVRPVFPALPDGVCPLFFPVIVPDKADAANALRRHGVDALEFWNDPIGDGGEMSPHARFFREHVLELPIHQDLSRRHISHVAKQLNLTLGAARAVQKAA